MALDEEQNQDDCIDWIIKNVYAYSKLITIKRQIKNIQVYKSHIYCSE